MGEYQIDWDRRVRIRVIDGGTSPDPMILAYAGRWHGKEIVLKKLVDLMRHQFAGRRFFASDPCDCGEPNCINRIYGTIGYLDGVLDRAGIAHGTQHVILRFDPVTTAREQSVNG